MEIHVCDENKLIDIWLTNAEKDSSRLIDSLKPLYQTYRNLNYTVAVFKSGSQDLYRQRLTLSQSEAAGRTRGTASQAVRRDTSFFSGMTYSGHPYPETEQRKDIFSCSFFVAFFFTN